MKFIAAILSVYIMVLTAMPCNDVHAANTNTVTIELSEHSPGNSSSTDLCSPFCYCDCCQTVSFTTSFIIPTVDFPEFTLNVTYNVSRFLSPVASIWQPPQN